MSIQTHEAATNNKQPSPLALDGVGKTGVANSFQNIYWQAAGAVLMLLGLVPFIFILWLIHSTGANNISVDYAAFLHVVDKVLSGQYQWFSIFSDSFIRTHMVLIPILMHIALAYMTHWNVTTELYVGMAIHLVRALLIADMVAGRSPAPIRAAVTGIVMCLVFAMSQTCIMIYGEASIAIGTSLLGFTFALWALYKFGRTPRGLTLMLIGGIVSSYSFGNVVACWLTLLLALLALPARGAATHGTQSKAIATIGTSRVFLFKIHVAVFYWSLGALVSSLPYIYFLTVRGQGNPELTKTFSLFDPSFMLNALGRPLAKDIGLAYGHLPGAELSASILIALLLLTALPSVLSRLKVCSTMTTSVLLLSYGFFSVWTVGIFRTHVAPWYGSFSLYCWLALIGMCTANLVRFFNSGEQLRFKPFTRRALLLSSLSGFAAVLCLYLSTNLTYKDKQFFLTTRSPASTEYIRNFETAPTFLESSVFSNDGRPDRIVSFAGALRRHDMAVFAPEQTWTLQGQFPLENVRIVRPVDAKHVLWLEGRSLHRTSNWRDYHHLNLAVPEGNVVEWHVNVPASTKEAIFETSVCRFRENETASCDAKNIKAVSTISVLPGAHSTVNGASYMVCCDDTWKPVQLNLLPYRGKSVTIRIGSTIQGNQYYAPFCQDRDCMTGSVVYMYPHISIVERDSDSFAKPEATAINPENVDVSPAFPRVLGSTWTLPELNQSGWKPVSIDIPEDKSAQMSARVLDIAPEASRTLESFDYLVMQLQAMPGKTWCSMKMHLQFDDGTTDGFSIPLLPDGKKHRYVYPLKLLTAKSGAKLTRVLALASTAQPNLSSDGEPSNLIDDDGQGVPLCKCVFVSGLSFAKREEPVKTAAN